MTPLEWALLIVWILLVFMVLLTIGTAWVQRGHEADLESGLSRRQRAHRGDLSRRTRFPYESEVSWTVEEKHHPDQ